jgi:hypothetical protein
MPFNLFQLIRKEKNKEDQGDEYEKKQNKIEEVRIHLISLEGWTQDDGLSLSYYEE